MLRRVLLLFVATVALAPLLADAPKPRVGTFTGKVVRLADVVAKAGTRLDADAAPFWLALATDDGKLLPLVKDGGARLFFKDAALLDRPMRLTGQLLPGTPLLRVTAVHSLKAGQPHQIHYWCDICSIERGEKMICECCGGPMELREEAAKK
jgi:hypothetical protein